MTDLQRTPAGDARMGAAPQHEQAALPALADREGVLGELGRVIADAWASFDAPRATEPELDPELSGRMRTGLPEAPGDAEAAVADAARLLDASVSATSRRWISPTGAARWRST